MPVSKHKRKGKVKDRYGRWHEGKGNSKLRRAINQRLNPQPLELQMDALAQMIGLRHA